MDNLESVDYFGGNQNNGYMNFPIIMESYEETQPYDCLIESELVSNSMQADIFKERHAGKKIIIKQPEISHIDKGEAMDKIILFFASPENKDIEHKFYEVTDRLSISREMATYCLNTMVTSKHWLKSEPSFNFGAVAKLEPEGFKHALELEKTTLKRLALRFLQIL
jgi:hypothetical protein